MMPNMQITAIGRECFAKQIAAIEHDQAESFKFNRLLSIEAADFGNLVTL